MSRTYRNQPLRNQFRHPRTFNEIRNHGDDYRDFGYTVNTRNRDIPTAWDDITATSIYQNDHHTK
jgi:hypothetical protein